MSGFFTLYSNGGGGGGGGGGEGCEYEQGVILDLQQQIAALQDWAEVPDASLYADFTKNRYAQNGTPASRADIYTHVRLSAATDFAAGKLVEFGENEPRISDKGLLLEPEATNEFTWSINQNGANSFPLKSGNYVFERSDLHEGYYGEFLEPDEISGYLYRRSVSNQDDATVSYILSKSNGSEDIVVGSSLPTYDVFISGSEASSSTLLGFGYIKIAGLEDPTGNNNRGLARYARQTGRDGNVRHHAMQKEIGTVATSLIITEDTPVTRSPDISRFPVAVGETVTFDGDEGISYVIEGGEAVFTTTKPAYLRSVEIN